MTTTFIDDAVRSVRAAVSRSSTPTLTGGQIASLIRSTVPDLDIRAAVGISKGSGAVTAFIEKYLSDQLEHIGKQGQDTLHHVKGREIQSPSVLASSEIWQTFVSPNAKQHLVLVVATGVLLSREIPASPDDEIGVPKATTSEHDAIRAEFSKSLCENSLFKENSDLSGDARFEDWIAALRKCAPGELKRWGHFRRQRLSGLLASRVSKLQIDGVLRDKVLAQVKSSEDAAYKPRKSVASENTQIAPIAEERQNEVSDETIDRARSFARAAIDQLSYDDLRALKIPLGALLDAIRRGT